MKRYRVQPTTNRRTKFEIFRFHHKPPTHGVLFDIPHTVQEFLFCRNLAFVETAHPHIMFALQSERESTFDVLHRLFQGDIRSRCNQRMKMVRHDDKCMQQKLVLTAIFENRLRKQFGCSGDLKKATSSSRHSRNQKRSSFLRCKPHASSINERPVAKAMAIKAGIQEPEGSCSLRNQAASSARHVWGGSRAAEATGRDQAGSGAGQD